VCSLRLPRSNPIWLPAAILKKMDMTLYSADDRLITTKSSILKATAKTAISLCYSGLRIAVANGRISKTRRHRSVLCAQTLKRTIAIAIAIAASCTFAYNFYMLKPILAVQFVLLKYRLKNYTEDRSTHNRLVEGLNMAIMASGQNSQKQ